MRNHGWQLHATALVILGGGHQAGVTQNRQGFADLLANNHLAVFEARLVSIAKMVVGSEGFRADLQRQLDGGIEGVTAMIFVTGKLGKAFDIEHFIQQKRQIVSVDDLLGQGKFLRNFSFKL